ncbi:Hypothetical_protein [Hexamita inflata]|uniref:Hypothetical_protein n=1 Tax=Hexamita inflata TaxID=28002 RepID=A0AA86NA90_9EUKA|nr:Hypothetical protein HINF_LOCUS3657 [Hexamita inflata]
MCVNPGLIHLFLAGNLPVFIFNVFIPVIPAQKPEVSQYLQTPSKTYTFFQQNWEMLSLIILRVAADTLVSMAITESSADQFYLIRQLNFQKLVLAHISGLLYIYNFQIQNNYISHSICVLILVLT